MIRNLLGGLLNHRRILHTCILGFSGSVGPFGLLLVLCCRHKQGIILIVSTNLETFFTASNLETEIRQSMSCTVFTCFMHYLAKDPVSGIEVGTLVILRSVAT